MWYVYILRSEKNDQWYTGMTQDLRKRLNQHNSGGSTYTKDRGPYVLMYYEASLDIDDARARELYLKSGMGKRFIKNRLKHYLSEDNESR